jgi:hypothetical protein
MWILFMALEGPPPHGVTAPLGGHLVALLAIFLGYAIAWRREFGGSLLSLGALAVYYAVNLWDTGKTPPDAMLLMALPPVLTLMAHRLEHHGPPACSARRIRRGRAVRRTACRCSGPAQRKVRNIFGPTSACTGASPTAENPENQLMTPATALL